MKFDRSKYSNRVEYALATGPVKAWMSVDRYRLNIGQAIAGESKYNEVDRINFYGHLLQPNTEIRIQTELHIGVNQPGQEPTFETGHASGVPSFGFLQTFEYGGGRNYAVALMAERAVYNKILRTLQNHAAEPSGILGWELEVIGFHSQEFQAAEIEYLPIVGFSLVLEWCDPTALNRDET